MEIRAVISDQVKKHSVKHLPENGVIQWQVDASRAFSEEANLGKLCEILSTNIPLEICDYVEGTIGRPLDMARSPDELGYKSRTMVYVRAKKDLVKHTDTALILAGGVVNVNAENVSALRRLRQEILPNLGPDDPCPLCDRFADFGPSSQVGEGSRHYDTQTGFGQSFGQSFPSGSFQQPQPTQQPPSIDSSRREKVSVGIQCGSAGSVHESLIPITLGTGGRFTEDRVGVPAVRRPAGDSFAAFSEEVSELKSKLDRVAREKEQLARELRDMTSQKLSLERWKAEQHGDTTGDVRKVESENQMLHTALREMTRGRDEVFQLLQQRRTAGLSLTDAPRPYAPFSIAPPSLDMSPTPVNRLLSPDSGTHRSRFEDDRASSAPAGEMHDSIVGSPLREGFKSSVRLTAQHHRLGKTDGPSLSSTQPNGECLLRVPSVTGDSFQVKRKVLSQARGGDTHVLLLLSLDGTVTDEILVNEVEAVSVDGRTGLYLRTRSHEWSLQFNHHERDRWLHWFYALNPFLSTQRE